MKFLEIVESGGPLRGCIHHEVLLTAHDVLGLGGAAYLGTRRNCGVARSQTSEGFGRTFAIEVLRDRQAAGEAAGREHAVVRCEEGGHRESRERTATVLF